MTDLNNTALNSNTINNPLLDFSGLPHFSEIKPEHVTPAMDALLAEGRAIVARLTENHGEPTWQNFVRPLEDIEEKISRAWGQVGHMNAVVNSPELREAYNQNLVKLTDFYTDLGQNEALFAQFKTIKNSAEYSKLDAAQRKIIDNELRDFVLSGADLPAAQKPRFKAIQEELSKLSAKFEENVLDATNDYALFIHNAAQLKGIPDDVLQAAQQAAAEADKPNAWKFTLHFPSYLPVMQYADDRELRETLYRAYATRASEFGNPDWNNTPLIQQILALRHEDAQMLGYENFATVSLVSKMAKSSTQVVAFLRELAARAKPYAERDMVELKTYAAKLGISDMQAWDVAYVSEKLREDKYAFSDQEVKQYLPEDQVLKGLFRVVETLFGIHVTPKPAPVWHADARFYAITDANHNTIGQFYFDLYARNNKRGGAWMDEAITRRDLNGAVQTPVAYLTCNFSAPIKDENGNDKPAYFTHDEVITLFHEFGHGLHHMLTHVAHYSVSGIKGVEWDAVELPSQFMENFCWEWDVLRHMTRHAETGEQIPRALFDKMVAAKNFQSGMQTVRQIEFSLFDMLLHSDFAEFTANTALQLLEKVRDEVAVVRPPEWNRFPNNFTHIFSGGYAAGYYSYKWAEVLSADAYSLFEEHGVLSAHIGKKFWQEILAQGGSRPAMESFIAFRGREPNIDALLRHNGMAG